MWLGINLHNIPQHTLQFHLSVKKVVLSFSFKEQMAAQRGWLMGCLIKGLFIMGRGGSRINTQCKIEGAITLYANQRSAGVREANQKLNLNSACCLPRLFVTSIVETAENWAVESASDSPFILTRFVQTKKNLDDVIQ